MTKSTRLVVFGLGAAYLVWRVHEAKGGPVVFVNPVTFFLPGNPSPAGTAGAGSTNPTTDAFSTFFARAFTPGNAPAVPALLPAPGTAVDPTGPPTVATRTAQPEGYQFVGEAPEFLPNLGDPNFAGWDYLATTPPDLFWGVNNG